jgi:hypothetical protein
MKCHALATAGLKGYQAESLPPSRVVAEDSCIGGAAADKLPWVWGTVAVLGTGVYMVGWWFGRKSVDMKSDTRLAEE